MKTGGMIMRFEHSGLGRVLALVFAVAALPAVGAAPKKKVIPVIQPEEKKPLPDLASPVSGDPTQPAALFEEIEFGSTLVIEGKVEKPQVQFTLLKEPPPEKEIRFETSFLQNILKQERENTFDAKERFGRE